MHALLLPVAGVCLPLAATHVCSHLHCLLPFFCCVLLLGWCCPQIGGPTTSDSAGANDSAGLTPMMS